MRKIALYITLLVFTSFQAWSQVNPNTGGPLLGGTAPAFLAESTTGEIDFPKDCGVKWKVLFSHPADFTPVCTSELLDLAALQDDMDKMGVKLVVVSTDNLETHQQWEKSMEEISYKNRPPEKINFPIVADNDHSIARKYGMIHPENNSTKDVRGVFIIDPQNKIRAMFYYPMNIGRNMEEIKRTVLALQTADKNNVLTPSDWQAGDDVIVPFTKYTSDQVELAKAENPDLYMVTWYMWFKKMK
jgi:peroxiredoxin 2/4